MKKRTMIWGLAVLMLMSVLIGCGVKEQQLRTEPEQTYAEPTRVDTQITGGGDHAPQIFVIDPNAPEAELPDASVPLASSPEGEISKREAEAIALAHAGFENSQVSFLYTTYHDDTEPHTYEVTFRHADTGYSILVDAVTGEVLS